MKTLLFLTAVSAVVVAVAAGTLLYGGAGQISANHEDPTADGECNIAGGGTAVGNEVANEPCVADYVALDAVTTGNTDSTLGTFEECVSVAGSASFAVDLVADAIPDVGDPTTDGLASWQALVQYDDSVITLDSVDRNAGTNLLGNNPNSALFNPPVSEQDAGPPRVIFFGSQDTAGGSATEEALGGVLARLNFTAGAGPALAQIDLLESFDVNTTKLITADNDTFGIGNFTGGENAGAFLSLTIAIDQACPLPPDPGPPTTSNVAAAPNPTNGAAQATVSATVSDAASGNRNIIAAELFIDTVGADGTGSPMAAVDSTFDEPVEDVELSIDASSLSLGDHTIFVHGQDAEGQWGPTASTVLSVTETPAGAETASISIIGGALFIETNPVDFPDVTLSGQDQTVDTQPAFWRAGDATGAGAGWNVTIVSSDFVSGANSIPVTNFLTKIDDANIVTESGNTPPASQVTTYQPLHNTTPLKLLSAAAGEGMGAYQFTPDFRLNVPAETGTGDYQALMTVTINAGP